MSRQSSGGSKGGATYGPNFLNFMQFFGKFVCSRLPLEGWRPSYGKSWIRPCRDIYKYGKYMNDPVADPGFFPMGLRQFTKLGLFCKFFADCIKMKEFEPAGDESLAPPLDPPMESVTVPVYVMIWHTAGRGGFHKGNEQLICFLFVIFWRLSYSWIGGK